MNASCYEPHLRTRPAKERLDSLLFGGLQTAEHFDLRQCSSHDVDEDDGVNPIRLAKAPSRGIDQPGTSQRLGCVVRMSLVALVLALWAALFVGEAQALGLRVYGGVPAMTAHDNATGQIREAAPTPMLQMVDPPGSCDHCCGGTHAGQSTCQDASCAWCSAALPPVLLDGADGTRHLTFGSWKPTGNPVAHQDLVFRPPRPLI